MVHSSIIVRSSDPLFVTCTVKREIFAGAKFRGNASRHFRNFHGFYFRKQMHDALTTPPPVDGHTPHANQRDDTEQRSEEGLCNFCVEAFAIMKVSGLPPWARNWLVEQKDSPLADLNFDNYGAPLTGSLTLCVVTG